MWDKSEYEVPESQFRERLSKVRDFADSNNLSATSWSTPRPRFTSGRRAGT